MIAYFYPPTRTSAVSRTVGFALNLARHGVMPTILTVRNAKVRGEDTGEAVPDTVPVIRAPELNLPGVVALAHGVTTRVARLATGAPLRRNYYSEYLCIPDEQIGWLALPAGWRAASRSHCLYVTCSPFSSALLGVALKRLTHRPLIVDFRDAWSMNPTARPSPFQRRQWTRLERFVISHCDRLILNTNSAEALYRDAYPEFAEKFTCIPNGFDELNVPTHRHSASFRITHVGEFYGVRQPDRLLQVLEELALPDVEFVQVGRSFDSYERFRRTVNITVTGTVPRREALARMREASLLYLRQHDDSGVAHVAVAAKTYEYLATGLPVLAECPPGENADVVARFGNRPYVVSSSLTGDLKSAVLQAYGDRHSVVAGVSDRFVETYSREALTDRLATLIKTVVATPTGRP